MVRGCEVQQGDWGVFVYCYCFVIVVVEVGGGYCVVGYWDLLWVNYLVVGDYIGYGVVVDGDEEGFFGYCWQMQNVVNCIGKGNWLVIQCVILSFQSLYVVGYFWCFVEQDVQWQVDWLIVKVVVVQVQMLFSGGFVDNGIRCVFVVVQFVEQWQLFWGDCQNIMFL